MAYYSRKLKIPFEDVLKKVIENLKQQGFGIITTIDVRDTFKQKLNISFRNYKILGACNPKYAYEAISLESHIGVMLPCNVVVQEHDNGEVEVSAINPLENIGKAFNTEQLQKLATEVGNKLRAAIDNLHCEISDEHGEALHGSRIG
ncbi:MAG: hypothetical protein C0490_13020 [Marivirga sp.]|nr:hypothetical protein [Marivirga sp.]